VITLFEGKQYDLWDIKGLAKNTGLRTQRSFRFQSEVYPGYSHARTLGNIHGGGGWKGEERNARLYIFELDNDMGNMKEKERINNKKRKKPPADDDSSSDEEDS
jgi:25S rRNA (uracil2634-N3)-methyltransferase